MNLTQDLFLDLYRLVVTETEHEVVERKTIVYHLNRFMDYVTGYLNSNPIIDTTEIKFYLECLKELSNEAVVFSNKTKLTVLISKWSKSFPDKKEKMFGRYLETILINGNDLSPTDLETIYKKLKNIIVFEILEKDINKIRYKLRKGQETADLVAQELFISDILLKNRDMVEEVKIISKTDDMAINAEFINMSQKESVINALKVNRLVCKDSGFKAGLQGINNVLPENFLTLGELVLIGALTHNYKSGLLMDFGRWIVTYNKPPKLDNKKPLVLFISLENAAFKNLLNWYKRAYFMLTGQEIDPSKTEEEMGDIIEKLFSNNGWEFHVVRKIGNFFTFEDYMKMIENYEKEGYRVYCTILDYIGKMNPGDNGRDSGSTGNRAVAFQSLLGNFQSYIKHKNMLFITAGQLNGEAGAIASSGCVYPINKFMYHTHFAVAKGLAQEADFVLLVHKEYNTAGRAFLTFRWAKHRDQIAPDYEKQFFAYPFTKHGIIDDLLLDKPGYVKDIYSFEEETKRNTEEIEDDIFN